MSNNHAYYMMITVTLAITTTSLTAICDVKITSQDQKVVVKNPLSRAN